MSTTNTGKDITTDNNLFNMLDFHIDYRLGLVNTIKVCAITVAYDDNTCDVKPLVPELDTASNPVAPQVLKKLPILQIQGGNAGLIIKYSVGDIVLCGFADRDITAVKAMRRQAAPLTAGVTPLNSGIVLGAVLFKNPQIYVKITDKIYLTGANVAISNDIQAAANAQITGNAAIGGATTIGGNIEVGGMAQVFGALTAASVVPQNGATGTFTDSGSGASGKTLTITNGIITGIN